MRLIWHVVVSLVANCYIPGYFTCVRTAEKARSHADMPVPVERVKADVSCYDGTRQVMIVGRLRVAVRRKLLLHNTRTTFHHSALR